MLTSDLFLYLTVLCCFHSSQGFFELPLDITVATEVLDRVTGQIVAGNDSKLQEFAEIFNYFVDHTQLENEGREEVTRLTTSNATKDDEDNAWQTALNDACDEENITTGLNDTLTEEVIKYIEAFVSRPENLKLTYLQNFSTSRRDDEADSMDSEEEGQTEFNPYWDITLTRRIFKGERVKIKLYPFVASVLVFNTFACAGSIIKSDLIITAASCLQLVHNNRFFRENPAFLSVRVGSPYFSIGGDVIPVIEVYFHPVYEPLTLHNNLAIMRLRRLLNFRHRKVKKIDIDRRASNLPVDTPGITIVGWGAKTDANKITAQMRLHAAELDYYDTESCREIYGKKFVTRTNFCAGFFSKGEGACNRDVGDPGVAGKYLVGVTSFGSPTCGKVDTPTVFTKLGYYADWIEEIMALEVPRMSKSTTTQAPFYMINKQVKLYGISDELLPIPLLRELNDVKTEPVKEGAAMQEYPILRDDGPQIAQYVEVDPAVEADPEITYDKPDKESPRIQPPTLIETGNVLSDYNNIQSDEDSEDETTMKPVERTTSIDEFEPTQHNTDTDVESVARTLKSDEINYKTDDASLPNLSDIADSAKRPLTAMVKAEEERTTSDFNPEMDANAADNFATSSRGENQDIWVDLENYRTTDNYAIISVDENQDMLSDKENNTTLRKKHHMPPGNSQIEVTDYPNQTDNQMEQNNNSVSLNMDGNGKSPELEDIHEDIDRNILDDQGPPENEEDNQPEQAQSKFQEEMADDMVKHEIQKLITQLEMSNEVIANVTEDRRHTNYTPLRHLVNNAAVDEAKPSESVLTVLYLTDNETEGNQRAYLNTIEEEGLSIDPAPFQRNVHMRSELLRKSEIYEIFANVMDTVANKSMG